MNKYKVTNEIKSVVSTYSFNGERLVIKEGEEKVISFTEFKRYEESLNALQRAGAIKFEKYSGKEAKKVKKPVKEENPIDLKEEKLVEEKVVKRRNRKQ